MKIFALNVPFGLMILLGLFADNGLSKTTKKDTKKRCQQIERCMVALTKTSRQSFFSNSSLDKKFVNTISLKTDPLWADSILSRALASFNLLTSDRSIPLVNSHDKLPSGSSDTFYSIQENKNTILILPGSNPYS